MTSIYVSSKPLAGQSKLGAFSLFTAPGAAYECISYEDTGMWIRMGIRQPGEDAILSGLSIWLTSSPPKDELRFRRWT